jgi:hypothetical protein
MTTQQFCDMLNEYRASGGTDVWNDIVFKPEYGHIVDKEAINKCPRLYAALVYLQNGGRLFYSPFDKKWVIEWERTA